MKDIVKKIGKYTIVYTINNDNKIDIKSMHNDNHYMVSVHPELYIDTYQIRFKAIEQLIKQYNYNYTEEELNKMELEAIEKDKQVNKETLKTIGIAIVIATVIAIAGIILSIF